MAKRRKRSKYQENLELALSHYPHLKTYIDKNVRTKGLQMPKYFLELDFSMKNLDDFNLIYPVGEPLFVHINRLPGEDLKYIVIEPAMDQETRKINDFVLDKMIAIANELDVPDKTEDLTPVLVQLLNKVVVVSKTGKGTSIFSSKISVTQSQ